METTNIYINGQIGSTYNDDGTIAVKGVELLDVVEQLAKYKDKDEKDKRVNVYIDSPGGYVEVGRSIAELLKSVPNCYTIARNQCASIATEIHLAVPLQNRLIEQGCDYMIHNPLFMGVNGDAEALKRLSEDIKKTESEMEAMYSKATGLSKEILSGLMQVETHLTAEQAVKLNFASQIVPKMERKAVAFIYNQNQQEMKKTFKERLALAMAVLQGEEPQANENQRNAVALDIATNKGVLVTEFDDVIVGDSATLNGEPAPTDTYVGENGMTYVVVDGVIQDIQEVQEEMSKEAELQAKIDELEAEKAQLAKEKEEAEAEKAQVEQVAEQALAKLEDLANKGSNFTPPASAQNFKPVEKKKPTSFAERKKLLTEKNN